MTRTCDFQIVLNVKPVGKARARVTRNGAFTPAKTAAAEAEIRWLLNNAKPPQLEGPVWLDVVATFQRPKSCSAKKRPLPVVKPDLSNVLKLVEDAANGVLFVDDAQVCWAQIEKRYGDRDSVEISAGRIGDEA